MANPPWDKEPVPAETLEYVLQIATEETEELEASVAWLHHNVDRFPQFQQELIRKIDQNFGIMQRLLAELVNASTQPTDQSNGQG